MSNLDSMWNEQHRAAAAKEGWELGLVVDSGKPVSSAYFDIFDKGPIFSSRHAAVTHVWQQAQSHSKLHIAALTACSASRVDAAARTQRKKR